MENRTVLCSTTVNDVTYKTKLTLDFSKVTQDDILQYAIRSLVIRVQDTWRRKEAKPPAEFTFQVQSPGTRYAYITEADIINKAKNGELSDDTLAQLQAILAARKAAAKQAE